MLPGRPGVQRAAPRWSDFGIRRAASQRYRIPKLLTGGLSPSMIEPRHPGAAGSRPRTGGCWSPPRPSSASACLLVTAPECCGPEAGRVTEPTERRHPVALTYTLHALDVMERRGIRLAWVERTVAAPAQRTRDPYDEAVERFYSRVSERGGRVLRVAVNTESDLWRVVTAFFDRSMRGGL